MILDINKMPQIVIVDDSVLDVMICQSILKGISPESNIVSFTDATQGLEYVMSNCVANSIKDMILFLDIYMPKLDGWDILSKLEQCTNIMKGKLKIFLLSSHVTERYEILAQSHKIVTAIIQKPISLQKVRELDFD